MARTPNPPPVDPWSWYDFKPTFGGQMATWQAPTWIGQNHRRLSAYKLLEHYYRNSARYWLDMAKISDEERDSRREYGDPAVIVETFLSSVIGDDQSIMVAGAESDEADERDPDAVRQATLLREWADLEQFDLKLIDCHRNSLKLGDGVYVLAWDDENNRPALSVYDPGFYFPVLPQRGTTAYPPKVHIGWEWEDYSNNDRKHYVTRKTWWLAPIVPHDADGNALIEPEDPAEHLYDYEEVDEETGDILRDYPWNEELSPLTCYYSEGTWELPTTACAMEDLEEDRAVDWQDRNLDLELDFIPVVHLPASVAGEEHYGTSVLAPVMQVFDDLVSTDTDTQAASATTGSPPIAISGGGAPKDEDGNITSYGPGTVLETGDGTATVIDTSRSLDALLKLDEAQLERLSVNGRVPEALLGRVKPNEVPSGIALTLSFTPHSNKVKEVRSVGRAKHKILLKFVSRFYMAHGELDSIAPAALVMGSFLPADKQEVVNLVSTMLGGTRPLISIETGVRMFMEAGFPIEDAVDEVRRIKEQDYSGAAEFMQASGDINATREMLGLPALTLEDNPGPTV